MIAHLFLIKAWKLASLFLNQLHNASNFIPLQRVKLSHAVGNQYGVCYENVAIEIQKIPLSDNTVSPRISGMAADILEQLRDKLLESKLFSIQLDESTDIKGKCQLLASVNLLEVIPYRKVFFFAENFQLVNWS